ncbi:MAG: PKD domain-containing protein, partial [bacterium]|nr:PKD domain-containing protein [bacterium]
MLKIFFKTTVFVVLFFIPQVVFGSVVMNEIAWMGTEVSSNEWIELYNNTNSSIDIGNWSIYGADTDKCINFSNADGRITTIVPAYGYLLYANHKDDIKDSNGTGVVDIWDATIGMNNVSPGQLILYDALNCEGNAIDTINQSTKWLAGNSTIKQTMERITAGWQTSLNPGGTPKAPSSSGAIEEPEEQSTEESETSTAPITNNPPLPDAGNDIIAFIGQEIKFDGTKSIDPDNDELAYSWNMGDGKLIEKPNFTYKYLYPGTYLVALMVYDGRNYVTDTITVKIQSAQITINEFMANPSEKDEEAEWIEV